jgi:hypothetical protein
MANLTSVAFTGGAQTSTGTVSTLDGVVQTANGPIAVKVASTAPAATDPALVVAISPNGQVSGQQAMSASAPVVIASDQTKVPVAGDIAHGSTDTSSNPVKQGFKATNSQSGLTLVTSGQRSDAYSGVDGIQLVRPQTNLEDIVTGTATDTAGASTAGIAAQAAGIKTYLTSIILCNSSSTNITVSIKNGVTTVLVLPVPANAGAIFNPPVPVPGSAATAWNFQGSAAVTTLTCSMVGFKSKI